MRGNVWEWNEAILSIKYRGLQGGGFFGGDPTDLAASRSADFNPGADLGNVGFRPTSRQFPQGIPSLSPIGLLVVTAGLLGFAAYRRGRA